MNGNKVNNKFNNNQKKTFLKLSNRSEKGLENSKNSQRPDKHKTWLLVGISVVIVAVLFIVLYSPTQEAIFGKAVAPAVTLKLGETFDFAGKQVKVTPIYADRVYVLVDSIGKYVRPDDAATEINGVLVTVTVIYRADPYSDSTVTLTLEALETAVSSYLDPSLQQPSGQGETATTMLFNYVSLYLCKKTGLSMYTLGTSLEECASIPGVEVVSELGKIFTIEYYNGLPSDTPEQREEKAKYIDLSLCIRGGDNVPQVKSGGECTGLYDEIRTIGYIYRESQEPEDTPGGVGTLQICSHIASGGSMAFMGESCSWGKRIIGYILRSKPPEEAIPGDMNSDGQRNIQDVLALVNIIIGS